MTQHLKTAFLMTVVTTVLLGLVYPLVITGLAQVLFPDRANGQLIERDGKVIGSRIISLPGDEKNIRGYSGVTLLVIYEAARVSDVLYRSVRPMLAVSKGRLVCLSTPFGKRGWFLD